MSSASRDETKAPPDSSRLAWIRGGPFDVLLFLFTPLIIVPLCWAARTRFSVDQIYLYVFAFAAIAHQLPGMIRAYGDFELFRRFRWRFILAPIFLLVACTVFAWRELDSLIVLLLFWGFWHVMMQAYRIVSIYDAKVGASNRSTSALDWLMCLAWFGGGLAWSPGRVELVLREFYEAGLPMVPPTAFQVFQWLWLAFTVGVTVLFTANYLRQRANGVPDNPVRLLAMVTSFAFWWFCMVVVRDALLGVAMFEVFHSIQYLALVWVFNGQRAAVSPTAGPVIRLLFRRNVLMLLVYLGMAAGYGFVVGMLPSTVQSPSLVVALSAVMAASTFLHFYIDGFVWDLREKSTRTALGLPIQNSVPDRLASFRSEAGHLLKWSLFIVPAVFLGISEYRVRSDDLTLEQYRNVALIVPNSSQAVAGYADALRRESLKAQTEGDELAARQLIDQAVEMYRLVVETDSRYYPAYVELGLIYRVQQRYDLAMKEFEAALEINPDLAIAHSEMGKLKYNDAVGKYGAARASRNTERLQRVQEEFDVARGHFARAVELAPDDATARLTLADYYRQHAALRFDGDPNPRLDVDELKMALTQFDAALAIDPEFADVYFSRGTTWRQMGELDKALADYDRAIEISPDRGDVYFFRATLHRSRNVFDKALADYRKATEDQRVAPSAHHALAETLFRGPAEIRDLDAAERNARLACELTELRNLQFLGTLVDVLVERGQTIAAVDILREAYTMADVESAPLIRQRVEQLEAQLDKEQDVPDANDNGAGGAAAGTEQTDGNL